MRFLGLLGILFQSRFAPVLLIGLQFLTACNKEIAAPTVDQDAELVLLTPKGGETFHVGDTLEVGWKAQGAGLNEISSVTVSLSPDSGQTWISLKNGSIAPADVAWGAFRWKIPTSLTAKGTNFDLAGNSSLLIRVQDYQNVTDPHKVVVVAKSFTVLP